MKGVGLMHLTRINLSSIKKFFQYLQEGVPGKLKAIHILNVVSFFDKILSLIKPFMKAEILKNASFKKKTVHKRDIANLYLLLDAFAFIIN